MEGRNTVTAQISDSENTFLETVVQKKEYLSKSEVVRDGIRAIMRERGYTTRAKV